MFNRFLRWLFKDWIASEIEWRMKQEMKRRFANYYKRHKEISPEPEIIRIAEAVNTEWENIKVEDTPIGKKDEN